MEDSKVLAEAEDMLKEIFGDLAPTIIVTKNISLNFVIIPDHLVKHRRAFLKEVLYRTIKDKDTSSYTWKIIDYIAKIQTETLLTKEFEHVVTDKSDKSMELVSKWRNGNPPT